MNHSNYESKRSSLMDFNIYNNPEKPSDDIVSAMKKEKLWSNVKFSVTRLFGFG